MAIVGLICALVAALGATILFAPIRLRAAYRLAGGRQVTEASLWWLSPLVAELRAARSGGPVEVRILNRRWGRRRPAREPGEELPGESPRETKPPPATEPPPAPAGPAPRTPEPGPPPSDRQSRTSAAAADEDRSAPSPDEATDLEDGGDIDYRDTAGGAGAPVKGPFRRLRARWRRLRTMRKSRLAWRLLRNAGVRKGTATWLVRIFASLRHVGGVDALRFHAAANLLNPAITGAVYGCWQGMQHALIPAGSRSLDLRFDPVFDREYLSIDAQARLSTSLGRLAWPALVAIAAFPYIRVGVVLWKASETQK